MTNALGLIEAVPNFSTSDPAVVARIVDALASDGRVRILDFSADADHNRAVVTVAGPPRELLEGLLAGCGRAVDLIDMRDHRGVHPRMGAVDVVPFVPLAGAGEGAAEEVAREFATRFFEATGVPVYFYGRLAIRPERRSLPQVRSGGFEGLAGRMPSDPPDIGLPEPHATAGATAVGVRPPLVAFNVLLHTGDLETARRIAFRVRESSGGLPGVQAMGVWLGGIGRAQVSMNLTDLSVTPVHRAVARLRELALEEGAVLGTAELIGMLPFEAIRAMAEEHLLLEGLTPGRILECAL